VSTAGLRKPVGELYPSAELLGMLVAQGKPVTLSSDAHEPENLGFGYDRALDHLAAAGVGEICVWDQREWRTEPVG
jgi:histidinol-phosphatase (PHP family)